MVKLDNIPDIITDDFIKIFFSMKFDHSKINPSRTTEKFINRVTKIKTYLDNRYPDSSTYLETIFRIFNNIESRPVCKCCGKILEFNKKYHFMTYCSLSCVLNSSDVNIKKLNTRYKHIYEYELNDLSFVEYVNLKREKTVYKKYGVKYVSQSNDIKEKIKLTNINNLGVPYTAQSNLCKEKMKETCLKKYGVTHNFQIQGMHDKIIKTWLIKYGETNPMKNKDVLNKNILTKKINHTFNTSKIEELFYDYLIHKFNSNDIIRQYKSIKYPYNCDFYIKPYDLYIEIQGYWAHGKHPYNKNNKDDLLLYNILLEKSKQSNAYKNALNIWAKIDVEKRTIAKINNLNYLEIFSINKSVVIQEFENFIKINIENKNE